MPPPPPPVRRIIDSHVHLWPHSMSNQESHSWMTPPGMPLAKEHLLSNYHTAVQSSPSSSSTTTTNSHQEDHNNNNPAIVSGIVYIETDVSYPQPPSSPSEALSSLSTWTTNPLLEIQFLKTIVQGEYGSQASTSLLGIVPWAPMSQNPQVLEKWLSLVQETAGTQTWQRIRGFRFLLQAIHDREEFESLVFGEDFVSNLKILGKRGFSFDIGVDEHSGGIWQLEAISKSMGLAHRGVPAEEKVVFVLNHLCKPNFADRGGEGFERWCAAIEELSKHERTYMKLSGAFSELPEGLVSIEEIVECVKPWVVHTFRVFGPSRIMFGSDWPVCNLRGPRKEESWVSWREVVEAILAGDELSLSSGDQERVWGGTALEAYSVSR